MNRRTKLGATLLGLGCLAGVAAAQETPKADGSVTVPSFTLPPSPYLSEQARKSPGTPADNGAIAQAIASGQVGALRARMPELMASQIKRHTDLYPVTLRNATIAGVPAVYATPPSIPPRNKGKILLNLPGGGFVMGVAGGTGMVESIPLASLAQVEIVSITYRQAPEHKFPAGSEDVAKVYRELLKTYKPENIGIFGCSAGGLLTAEALAWFQKEKLPRPRAAGIFCASADAAFGGDSRRWARPLGGNPPEASTANPYFAAADLTNPLASPYLDSAMLRQFPPTLVITSGRAMDLSGAINTHRELVKAGVDTELHVWDGLGHAFFYNIDLPESREAYDVMTRFFGKHMGLETRR